jgi:hypothetical protein
MAPTSVPGSKIFFLWRTSGIPRIPVDDLDPTSTMTTITTPAGQTQFAVTVFPPARDVDGAGGGELGGLADELRQAGLDIDINLDGDAGGSHATDSIDYGAVLSGAICLALEDHEVELRAGDCFVLLGGKHAWHNRTEDSCAVLFAAIGAERVDVS